jgi:hypothetical protein
VNPDESQVCDCGYDRVTKTVGRRREGTAPTIGPRSWFVQYQLFRFGIVGATCWVAGLALLSWELADDEPNGVGIIQAAILMVVGLTVAAFSFWKFSRE